MKCEEINMAKPIDKKIKAKAIAEVKKGKSFNKTAKKYGIALNTISQWCKHANVKSPFPHKMRTDEEILSIIKDFKAATAGELRNLLGYAGIQNRLRRMVRDGKITHFMIPASSRAARTRGLFTGYTERKIYYIDKEDLTKWVRDHLPKHLPPRIRKVVTRKFSSLNLEISKPKEYTTVMIKTGLHKKLKQKAEEKNITIRILAEKFIRKGLKEIKG